MAVHITRTGVALTVGVIILGLAALGGLYAVKQHGEQARRDEAIAIAQQQLESESRQEVALNDGEDSTKTQPAQDEQSNGGERSSDSTSELPQTGAGSAWTILLAGVVTYVVVFFASSRVRVAQLARLS